jgi:hypothetical protein
MVRRRTLYVIARNSGGRPTLQHKLPPGVASTTCCGYNIEGWSRAYSDTPIPEVLCRTKACRE